MTDLFQIDNLLYKDSLLIVEPFQIDFFRHNIDIRHVENYQFSGKVRLGEISINLRTMFQKVAFLLRYDEEEVILGIKRRSSVLFVFFLRECLGLHCPS